MLEAIFKQTINTSALTDSDKNREREETKTFDNLSSMKDDFPDTISEITDEITIPKHRFDEVNSKYKEARNTVLMLEEENGKKDGEISRLTAEINDLKTADELGEAGIGLEGKTIKTDRNPDLIGRDLYGYLWLGNCHIVLICVYKQN